MRERCNRCDKMVETVSMRTSTADLTTVYCNECGHRIKTIKTSTGAPTSAPHSDTEYY